MKIYIYKLLIALSIIFYSTITFSQDSTIVAPKKRTAAKHTFDHGVLINNQTVEKPNKKTLDFIIQHRFGIIKEAKDLYGIYGAANIRMGLDYGITKRLAIGVGATKNKHYFDLEWKYLLVKQMSNGGFPISIAYYGDIARSADDKDKFINQDSVYRAANKVTYFHEIMFARKFNTHISLQVAGTYSYYNIVDSILNKHDFFGASVVGRYKFSPQSSVQVEFDYPLNVSGIDKKSRPKPNLGLGFEVSTSSHQFQVFVCTANGILGQETRVHNLNDFSFSKREVMIGFNITRQWGF